MSGQMGLFPSILGPRAPRVAPATRGPNTLKCLDCGGELLTVGDEYVCIRNSRHRRKIMPVGVEYRPRRNISSRRRRYERTRPRPEDRHNADGVAP